MNKALIAGGIALIMVAPVMADTTSGAGTDLATAQAQIDSLKQQLERLEATVDYLKANAAAERKDSAVTAVDVGALKTATSRYTWSGDFRYRHEYIDAEENVTGRTRERIRVRFGVLAKVNDTINARLQLSTTNTGNDNARSTNQTLGSGWDRKPLSIDLAYADWKATNTLNVVLGKMPIPWTKTASYFWDNDLTPEGAALKFNRGPIFAGVYYDWLSERDSASSIPASTDATMFGAQLGIRQPIGKSTLTGAIGYFDLNGVKDRIAGITTATTTGCTIDSAFGGGQGTANNAFGNDTYDGPAPLTGSGATCTRLRDDYNLIEAQLQFDTTFGKFPFSAFVDYMKNGGVISTVTDKQDTAYAAGFVFNKASAAKTWEVGYTYQKAEKNGVFGNFHDSDFGGGVTDTDGSVVKVAYVPATNWTLNGTYFINQRFIDSLDTKITRDYKRLQLDLNYKF